MITEKELKDKCTTEFIKWMVELAEGFSYIDEDDEAVYLNTYCVMYEFFPLLIHRAVEGFNKINEPTGNYGLYIDREKITYCNFKLPRNEEKIYQFKNYQPQSLTQAECALLHCLLDVFETGGE